MSVATSHAEVGTAPDLGSYDRIIVAFSGGKDSLACLLHLLEQGVDREKLELRHHEVDGREGRAFMDWPSTPAYCAAVAKSLGVTYLASWKVGGFEREMTRNNTATAATRWENHDGSISEAGGKSGKLGTRMKFPQVAADLSCRWCSAYLKVDVMSILLANTPLYQGKRILVVTGERAQESPSRSRYKTFERGRGHTLKRHVDHWRPVHGWSEREVWGIIRRHGVVPHPAYSLGWSRLSCMTCIFGSANLWATVRAMAPERFERIAAYERQFGRTIHRKKSVTEQADAGTPFATALGNPELFSAAMDPQWNGTVRVPVPEWALPSGAFGENSGPT